MHYSMHRAEKLVTKKYDVTTKEFENALMKYSSRVELQQQYFMMQVHLHMTIYDVISSIINDCICLVAANVSNEVASSWNDYSSNDDAIE